MKNGEVIKNSFPHYDIEIYEHDGYVHIFYEDFYTTYPWRWWNAEYQGPPMQKPKKGQWILDDTDNSIECSLCGCKIWANDIMDGEAHYCPNCGADMRRTMTSAE